MKDAFYIAFTVLISSGGFTAFWSWLSNRRRNYAQVQKTSAEAVEIHISSDIQIGHAWKEYAKEMQNRMEEFEGRLEDALADSETLRGEVKRLKTILKTNGIKYE